MDDGLMWEGLSMCGSVWLRAHFTWLCVGPSHVVARRTSHHI